MNCSLQLPPTASISTSTTSTFTSTFTSTSNFTMTSSTQSCTATTNHDVNTNMLLPSAAAASSLSPSSLPPSSLPSPSSALINGVSASLGAMVTACLVTPLDVAKTRLQSHICMDSCGNPITRPQVHVSGTVDVLSKIVQREGISSLWRGLQPAILMAVPTMGIYFTSYEYLKTNLVQQDWISTTYSPFISGAAARVAAATVTSPLELIRTNLQASTDVSWRAIVRAALDQKQPAPVSVTSPICAAVPSSSSSSSSFSSTFFPLRNIVSTSLSSNSSSRPITTCTLHAAGCFNPFFSDPPNNNVQDNSSSAMKSPQSNSNQRSSSSSSSSSSLQVGTPMRSFIPTSSPAFAPAEAISASSSECCRAIASESSLATSLASHSQSVQRASSSISFTLSRVAALWTGIGPTLLRDVPFSALYWSCYESFRPRLQDSLQDSQVAQSKLLLDFFSGCLAGSIAAFITTPADVVKTRQQTSLFTNSVSPPITAWSRARLIWQAEGLSGFYLGLGARLAKVAPSCGVTIASYEFFKSNLTSLSSTARTKF